VAATQLICGRKVTRNAANPNADKMFLNWCMSEEWAMAFQIKELGLSDGAQAAAR